MAEINPLWKYIIYNEKRETWTYTDPLTEEKYYSNNCIDWFSTAEIMARLKFSVRGENVPLQ